MSLKRCFNFMPTAPIVITQSRVKFTRPMRSFVMSWSMAVLAVIFFEKHWALKKWNQFLKLLRSLKAEKLQGMRIHLHPHCLRCHHTAGHIILSKCPSNYSELHALPSWPLQDSKMSILWWECSRLHGNLEVGIVGHTRNVNCVGRNPESQIRPVKPTS